MPKKDLKDFSLKELEDFLQAKKYPAYHSRQIFSWIYKKDLTDFQSMSDLTLDLRRLLAENFYISQLKLIKKETSRDATAKFLFALGDGNLIESAIIPTLKRNTACISSQIGCKFKCGFCASGIGGWRRNLSASEIINQLIMLNNFLKPLRISHVVFMGTGEPLDNYENVLKAIRIINSPQGFGIAARRITISTSGIIPGIERLMKEKLQIELSVSLHAGDDTTRNKLMPVNKEYPLARLITACRNYSRLTNRQVTFEYILIKGFNSGLDSALNLTKLLKGWNCKVNLIPYNPIKEFTFTPPTKLEVLFFQDKLLKAGVKITLRMPRGTDISAACGQLRYYTLQNFSKK